MPILQMVAYPVEGKWKPWANTLFYASLNWNYNSEWTLNPSYNTSSWVTYPSLWNIQYAYVNSGQMVWNIWTPPTNNITFQARVNWISEWVVAVWATTWGAGDSTWIELYFSWTQRAVYTQNSSTWYGTTSNSNTNTWYLVTWVKNWTTLSLYKNWTLIWSVTCASSFNPKTNIIIANNSVKPVSNTSMRVSKIIFENIAWTQAQIQDYYNQTKSNYWL